MNYKTEEDKTEWEESYEMLNEGDEIVLSELSVGKHVIVNQKLFNKMIEEINDARRKFMKPGESVEFIVLSEE